jgi:predicted PurR-regulated permease PerM
MKMKSAGSTNTSPTTQAIEIAIRLGLIFLILAWCLQIIRPFVMVIAWGAIIAIAIYPLFMKLVAKLGGKKKLAVALITLVSITALVIPLISLSESLITGATTIGNEISTGKVNIPPPSESVKSWPMVGDKAYAFWQDASVDLTALLEKYPGQLAEFGKKLLGLAASTGLAVLQFIISMLIAAAFLASADSINKSLHKLAGRLSTEHGKDLLVMSEKTIRSVAVGVIGIAFIQAFLAGIGMMAAGIPAAGLLAIFIMVLGIAQLPPLLVLLPVTIYLFSGDSTTVAVLFLVWSILVSASDMVLKPLLLGRGVDAPMLVILLGAIGGLVTSGIVGLFIGAVVLAVGYKLLLAWVDMESAEPVDDSDSLTN